MTKARPRPRWSPRPRASASAPAPARASAAILAGGRSMRMGFDKARALIAGESLVERRVRALAGLVREVLVVANDARRLGLARLRAAAGARGAGLRAIADHGAAGRRPVGPLGGLVAALAAARFDPVLVTAADMISGAAAVRPLIALCSGGAADAWVPRAADGGLEPLLGAYRRRALGPLEGALAEGVRSLRGALERVRVRVVEPRAFARWEPAGRALVSLNTPRELRGARAAFAEGARW